jgi:hypothetical protein
MQLMDPGLGLLLANKHSQGRKTLLVGRLVAFLLYSTNTLLFGQSVYQRVVDSQVDQLLVIVGTKTTTRDETTNHNQKTNKIISQQKHGRVSGHCDPILSA